MPTALMLVKEDATVTICHSRSENLPAICRGANILVSAVGKPAYVKGDWVREGAVVIDVGISRVPDERSVRGYRMVGDVDFAEVSKVASAMTKVTGGVGPMTIAMLMRNTLAAAQMQQGMQPA
jgi:5,10-methylene-tetrahydrofolate dehydrogenase/methenyl tetrahydrofolate cyclohydrolase